MGPTRCRTTPACRTGVESITGVLYRGPLSIQRFLISVELFLRSLGCARRKRWWWRSSDGSLWLRMRIVFRSYCTRFDTDKYRCKIAVTSTTDQTQRDLCFALARCDRVASKSCCHFGVRIRISGMAAVINTTSQTLVISDFALHYALEKVLRGATRLTHHSFTTGAERAWGQNPDINCGDAHDEKHRRALQKAARSRPGTREKG
jgi:hypothetical protein